MFFLFARSLAERELSIKLAAMATNFDIKSQMIHKKHVLKISKIYFQNITGDIGGPNNQHATDNLSNHFVTQLIRGAQETQDFNGELYDPKKFTIQLTFFLIKLLREFQT